MKRRRGKRRIMVADEAARKKVEINRRSGRLGQGDFARAVPHGAGHAVEVFDARGILRVRIVDAAADVRLPGE